jgi:hypothetical protein
MYETTEDDPDIEDLSESDDSDSSNGSDGSVDVGQLFAKRVYAPIRSFTAAIRHATNTAVRKSLSTRLKITML